MVCSKVLSVSSTVLMGPAFLEWFGSPGASAGVPASFPADAVLPASAAPAVAGWAHEDGRPGGPGACDPGHEVANPRPGAPAGQDPPAADPVSSMTAVAADLAAVSRRARWAGPVFAVLAALMVPWTIYLAVSLPSEQRAAHYDLAWAGFDVGLFPVLAVGRLVRRDAVAVAGRSPPPLNAGFLVVDAWFDVVTAPDRRELVMALASAALIELPLAAVSVWLAVNGQRIFERRITLARAASSPPHEPRRR